MWSEHGGTWNKGYLHTIDNWIILEKLTFYMNILFGPVLILLVEQYAKYIW
jgi:hypothetical protein